MKRLTCMCMVLCLTMVSLVSAEQITLEWDAYTQSPSPAAEATQINIYRRDHAPTTTFAVIATVPIAATTFTYAAVISGDGYCYVVTASNPTLNLESTFSNEVCDAAALQPPGAPVALRIKSTTP